MKKLIVLFSAVAALAACSKNEVVPAVSGENVEISYKVAPRTKADPQAFDTKNVFASWAYYLPNEKKWDANRTEAKEYISNSEISFNDGVWKNKDISHYWPNGGSLTFFAYSLNSSSLTDKSGTDTHFTCENYVDPKTHVSQYGICGMLNLDTHPNTDFLVADIAIDKNAHENIYNFNGVPTLFKHKLSRVKFAVKKKSDYPGATITLNSITFKNLVNGMTYTQYRKEETKDLIPDYITDFGASRSTQEYTKTDFIVSSFTSFDPVPDANEVRYIYIPQDFKSIEEEGKIATIEVKYTVTDKEGISKTYTKTLKVKDIFESWKIGKRYTFNLMFSLNEINWAPAVGDWEDEIKNIDIETGKADVSIHADVDTTTDEQC